MRQLCGEVIRIHVGKGCILNVYGSIAAHKHTHAYKQTDTLCDEPLCDDIQSMLMVTRHPKI